MAWVLANLSRSRRQQGWDHIEDDEQQQQQEVADEEDEELWQRLGQQSDGDAAEEQPAAAAAAHASPGSGRCAQQLGGRLGTDMLPVHTKVHA